jgi:GxxExxY protein
MITKELTENEISYLIRKAIFNVYNSLGPGLLEKVYVHAIQAELVMEGLQVQTEVPIPVIYDTLKLEVGFRLDLLVNDRVVVEVKSIEAVAPVHHKILITYLKLANKKLGLLVNFSTDNIEKSIYRKVNGL